MKQFVFQAIGLVILIFAGLYYSYSLGNNPYAGNNNSGDQQGELSTQEIKIVATGANGSATRATIQAEVADSQSERSKGLGGRSSLPQDGGMLFIFDKPGKYNFWMKGLSFPLDFIWIKDNMVVDLLSDVQPPQSNTPDDQLPVYGTTVEVDKVLEVNAGYIQSHNIQVGDRLQ